MIYCIPKVIILLNVQIVEAITYCHGRGIFQFYRDIKDENVLINVKTGHIKLASTLVLVHS